MIALQFITDHVIFKLRYNQIYQIKTTIVFLSRTAKSGRGSGSCVGLAGAIQEKGACA